MKLGAANQTHPLVSLGEVCSVLSGFAWKSKQFNQYRRGLPIIRIQNVANNEDDFVYWEHDFDSRFVIKEGDLLLTLSGSFRTCVWDGPEGLLNQRIVKLEPCENVDIKWFLYLLRTLLLKIEGMGRHALVNNVSITDLREIRFPLPPLPEQRRIAAILDKADAIRRKRQQAIELTEEFLKSAFLEMFGDPVTNPKGWKTGVLGDVIHTAKDGPHVSPEYANDGIPFLSTRHIKPQGVVWEDLKYISNEEAARQWKKCKPTRGDVLYTKGGTTGIATAVDFDREVAVWVHVALLKTNHERADSYWLSAMLNTAYCYGQSQKYTHGITNKDLGLTRMVKIEMYLPPLEMQRKYSAIVQTAKRWRMNLELAGNRHENLFNSLVQRAFRGELSAAEAVT